MSPEEFEQLTFQKEMNWMEEREGMEREIVVHNMNSQMDAIRQEKIEENFFRSSNFMKKFDDDIFNLKYKMFPLGTSE